MINISQSFLKSFNDMKQGKQCGLFIKAMYIDKTYQSVSSDVQELGNFFEFMATGSLPRDGHVPKAKIVYEGTTRQRISEDYQRAINSSIFFKEVINQYNIKIVETSKVITQDGMTGILDIVANWNDRVSIIDTKYSGLLYDRWNEMGWDTDSLPEKHKTMIQGVHYKILMSLELGIPHEDIDFYFFIFSSQDPKDAKIIKLVVDESTIQQHLIAVNYVKEQLKKPIDKVFKANPTLQRCNKCPIRDNCDFKIELPTIEEVYY